MQRTADCQHQITDALLPLTARVFDNATVPDTAVRLRWNKTATNRIMCGMIRVTFVAEGDPYDKTFGRSVCRGFETPRARTKCSRCSHSRRIGIRTSLGPSFC